MIYLKRRKEGTKISEKKTKAEIQREYSKRTNYAAQRKYDKDNTKMYSFRFMKNSEADLIEKLDSEPNKSGYIKKLIRDDIAKEK